MRLLLILNGFSPSTDPSVIGEFRFVPEFDAYVWEGRALDADEFNQLFSAWLQKHARQRGVNALSVRAVPEEQLQQGAVVADEAHNLVSGGSIPSPATPPPMSSSITRTLAEAAVIDADLLRKAAKAQPKRR